MSVYRAIEVLRKHPEGVWIRELARKSGVSPATICNYIYGYTDNNGRYHKGALKNDVELEKLGNGAITLVRLR